MEYIKPNVEIVLLGVKTDVIRTSSDYIEDTTQDEDGKVLDNIPNF